MNNKDNGHSTLIWLDLIFKTEPLKVVNWSHVNKEDYLLAVECSPIKDIEIKHLLKSALTDRIDSREAYMKDIDHRSTTKDTLCLRAKSCDHFFGIDFDVNGELS